jgi:hypothetical protein
MQEDQDKDASTNEVQTYKRVQEKSRCGHGYSFVVLQAFPSGLGEGVEMLDKLSCVEKEYLTMSAELTVDVWKVDHWALVTLY